MGCWAVVPLGIGVSKYVGVVKLRTSKIACVKIYICVPMVLCIILRYVTRESCFVVEVVVESLF